MIIGTFLGILLVNPAQLAPENILFVVLVVVMRIQPTPGRHLELLQTP
uniref:Uncharacterized protein n=1 Tax=Picea glauca TaxID=3330 RepID=A0A124GNV6_PICGL|nr:hypothetical protein ABT39_MTgene3241 [Picea glauca]